MAKVEVDARVLLNQEVAPGVFCITLRAPAVARLARPGQFVHVRVVRYPVQTLRMPFCVYDANVASGTIDICFQVVGEGTLQLARLTEDDMLSVVGPIGHGWSIPYDVTRALLIGGGMGIAPLNLLARELSARGVATDAVLAARSADLIIGRDLLGKSVRAHGGRLFFATDDGTLGTHGFANAVSDPLIASDVYDYVCVCGPAVMERIAVRVALAHGVRCEVSLERLMACGIGICLSCVVDTTRGRLRCCADGPVFDAAEVMW